VTYIPIQAVPPVTAVKGRDADTGSQPAAGPKLRAAPPPGAGSLLDIEA
jgi:hypothetical protein